MFVLFIVQVTHNESVVHDFFNYVIIKYRYT